MNAQKQQHYLKAMNIQPWFSQYTLPGAKPSVRYTLNKKVGVLKQAVDTAAEKSLSQPIPPIKTLPVISQMLEAISDNEPVAARKTSVQQREMNRNIMTENRTDAVKPSQTAAGFRLTSIHVNDEILVVTDTLNTLNSILNTAHKRLLLFILFSLKWLKNTTHPVWKSDIFTWPMTGMLPDLTHQHAGEAVQGFLHNRFNLQHRKYVLLLGKHSARYTLGNYQQTDQLYGAYIQDNKAKWGVSYSLDQILKLPVKAEVWQHLLPLCNG
ncbi:MAG: hypothetical protein OXC48_10215 [Endozoicomonadaceae bacterium]|nr:hypothetical protein [Endozoicomonadaceae bacterium]